MSARQSVGVVGLGYTGLPLAVALAAAGHRVVGLDIDLERVGRLAAGSSPIDDVSDDDVQAARSHGMVVTSDPSALVDCWAVVICVPTPLTADGAPDSSPIAAAVEAIAPNLAAGCLVVLESTSYPGTTEELVAARLTELTGLSTRTDLCIAFSPERIDPGNPSFGLANTPRIVAGLHPCCLARATDLYCSVVGQVVPAAGLREAELAKLLENTYRQVNIALMNELARFARLMDIDLYEAVRCAATKPYGFEPFRPGPGVGGHCIPIDPRILASRVESELGSTFRFVELAQEINESMPRYVVQRLADELAARGSDLAGARVLVLGVAYKADVSDVRGSPALDVIRELRSAGATAQFWDPHVHQLVVDGEPVARVEAASGQVDAVALLQGHREFEDVDLDRLAPVVLDCTGAREGAHVVRL